MRTLKSRISLTYITSCLCLLNAICPYLLVTEWQVLITKIYANEQLLLVSQTSGFEFSDLTLNNRELITFCTLPAFIKLPCHLSSSKVFARMPMTPYMYNHTAQFSLALSLQLWCFYQCLSSLHCHLWL